MSHCTTSFPLGISTGRGGSAGFLRGCAGGFGVLRSFLRGSSRVLRRFLGDYEVFLPPGRPGPGNVQPGKAKLQRIGRWFKITYPHSGRDGYVFPVSAVKRLFPGKIKKPAKVNFITSVDSFH